MRAGKRFPIPILPTLIAPTLIAVIFFNASDGSAEAASPAPSLVLHVCRMAGLGSDTPAAISIPRGTRFDDKDTALLAQPELAASGPVTVANAAPVVLTTSAALTLPQNRYCADVAAVAAAGTSDQALAAASGRLFAVAGHDNLVLLGEIYATYDRAGD